MDNKGRRHKHGYRSGKRRFNSRKATGWGMNLFRNTRQGKIAGVAAGLADHWDIAHWVVRLLWVGAFLFTGTPGIAGSARPRAGLNAADSRFGCDS